MAIDTHATPLADLDSRLATLAANAIGIMNLGLMIWVRGTSSDHAASSAFIIDNSLLHATDAIEK